MPNPQYGAVAPHYGAPNNGQQQFQQPYPPQNNQYPPQQANQYPPMEQQQQQFYQQQ